MLRLFEDTSSVFDALQNASGHPSFRSATGSKTMQTMIGNFVAAAAMVVTVVLFEMGLMAPGNAFFAVTLVILMFTANQLIARENQPLRDAVVNMFTNPASYAGRGTFAAYVGSTALGAIVIVQTLAYI
ncbi:hypothetical protein [Pyruvatibacter sp.]|nr:hypothetical protein [Alphaproteobacteria bacterium]